MDFFFNVYSTTLVFFGSATLMLSLYIINNEAGTVRSSGLLMLSSSIWSVAYGFELGSTNIEQMKLLTCIEYIGIGSLPISWLVFCLDLVGREKWLQSTGNKLLVAIVPVVTVLLVWTNDFHHLHFSSAVISYKNSFPMLKIVHGISYYIFVVYFYILLAVGNYMLIRKFNQSDAIYRNQNRVILLACLLPWFANLSYQLGYRPASNFDVTPFAFGISTVIIFFAIYRFRLFDTLPIAREKVLELMQDGFVVLDHKNNVIDYNTAFKKFIYGNQSGQLIGKDIHELLPGQQALTDFLNQHESGKIELLVHNNNLQFDLEADVHFLNQNKLNRNTTIIKFQDLTDLRQEALKISLQADELQKLNQLKDRIFSIMAHDLRGPLLNLAEVLKMISDDTISTEEFKMLSPTLTKDISYTTDLLENILHWSRSQLKGYSINREYFDLKALITSEINYHRKPASQKKIDILLDEDEELTAYADLLMMQMVIRNLLSNAIKFCVAGCKISISAHNCNAETINLCIKDNGVGISEASIKRIFNGENVSSRGTQNEKGTGIGLMVCWDFMARNEGSIEIESEVGKGTSFNLVIPRVEA